MKLALPALLLAAATPLGAQDSIDLVGAARLAIENHPSVAAAEARLREARSTERVVRSARLPNLGVSAGLTRFQEPMIVAPLHAFDPSRPPSFSSTLLQSEWTARYLLFDGTRGSRIDAAGAGSAVADLEAQAAVQDLLVAVARAYLAVQSAELRDSAALLNEAALQGEVGRVRQMFDQGRAARVDLVRARAAAQLALADRQSTIAERQLARRDLSRLTGAPLDSARLVPVTEANIDAVVDRARAHREAIAANLDLQRATQNVAVMEARSRAARGSWVPEVGLIAGVSTFGSTDGNFVGEWRAGVAVSYPIFTGGARSAEVSRADAALASARESRALAEIRVAQRVDTLLARIGELTSRRAALREAVTLGEEVARIELLRLQSGTGIQNDYLRAQADLLRSRTNLINAEHALMNTHILLAATFGRLTTEWLEPLEN